MFRFSVYNTMLNLDAKYNKLLTLITFILYEIGEIELRSGEQNKTNKCRYIEIADRVTQRHRYAENKCLVITVLLYRPLSILDVPGTKGHFSLTPCIFVTLITK